MHKFFVIVVAGLLAMSDGCRSTDCDAVYKHSPWEDAEGVKSHMDAYKHILTARIYENHGEDRGPNKLSVLHFKGTVVKSYKGDWKPSEKISFVHYVDYRASTTISNQAAGDIVFVFTNEHANTDIVLDTTVRLSFS